jgi:menaquinol-cytochrome c reductase iron-sulfur subunit
VSGPRSGLSPHSEPAAADRRTFLKWLSGILGAVTGALVTVPALRAFVAPLRAAPTPENWVRLGEAAEFDLDLPVKVDFVQSVKDAWVEKRALHNVWVYTEDGENFTVYSGRCPHLGCGFAYDEAAEELHCPCHHGRFDPATGAVKGGPPPRGLDTLETRVERGILYASYQDFRVGVPEKVPLGWRSAS